MRIPKTIRYLLLALPFCSFSCRKATTTSINTTTLALNIEYPSNNMPLYTKNNGLILRTVIELYNSENEIKVLRKVYKANQPITFTLTKGKYDIKVWSDYSTTLEQDYYYNTSQLNYITIANCDNYTGSSDLKDSFAGSSTIEVEGKSDSKSHTITLQRPFAKYQIVTNDIKTYEKLKDKSTYTPLTDLTIKVTYEGYLPTAYNITNWQLAGAEKGYGYTSSISNITDTSATISSDYIFATNIGSSINATIYVCNKSGEVVAISRENNIPYKMGQLTTITGNFLTDSNNKGITINPTWSDDDFNISF